MGGRGARIELQTIVLVEQPHRQAEATEQQGAKQSDRAAAGDQHPTRVVTEAFHGSLTPAIFTASAHSGISAAIVAANSSGVLPSGSTP